jgi:hypothetical protein
MLRPYGMLGVVKYNIKPGDSETMNENKNITAR